MTAATRPPNLLRTGRRRHIKESITGWMREQGLAPGDRIPGQNELAAIFSTTPLTIHRALSELSNEGVVRRESRRGTFAGPALAAPHTRQICLVLPSDHLDEPAHNPIYWPYTQKLYRSFLDAVGGDWIFSSRVIAPGTPPGQLAPEFASYDGVFFLWVRQPADLLRELIERRIAPVVCFGQPAADTPCLTLDHDAVAGARKAVRHLFALGYRRIALVASDRPWGDLWLEGYRRALADSDASFAPERVVRVGETRQDGADAASTLVARGLPCDAVFADTDLHALGVVEGFIRHGVRVPEDVGVMGYDGLDIAVNHPPHLTSLDVPHQAMIKTALDVLQAGGRAPTEHKHVAFVGDVLVGQTAIASRQRGVGSPASCVPCT